MPPAREDAANDALQSRVEELAGEVKELRARLDRLEARGGEGAAPDRLVDHEPLPGSGIAVGENLTLGGRTLVALGGGYLLRELTPFEGATTAAALGGVAAGLAYGCFWLFQADRAGKRGRRLSATFHGLAAAVLVCPLVWETTARFPVLSTVAAAAVGVVFLVAGLLVAARRQLPVVAWTLTLAVTALVLVLFVGTHDLLTLTVAGLVTCLVVEAAAYREHWLGLRWPVALALDAMVVATTQIAIRPHGLPDGYPPLAHSGVIAVCLALPVLYLVTIAARCVLRGRPVSGFGVVQASLALAIGLSGAVRVIDFDGGSAGPIGIASLGLGAVCYTAAYVVIDRRLGRGRNFLVSTTLALVLILVWSPLLLGGDALAVLWSALALPAVWLGGRHDRIVLRYHGAAYLVAACVGSGLALAAADGLGAPAVGPWRPVTLIGLAVAALTCACYGILVATRHQRRNEWWHIVPRAIIVAAAVWCVAGLAARWLAGLVTGAPSADVDVALAASTRTAVVAGLAVLLAWAGQRWSLRTLPWMVYPLMIGGACRVILEDLEHGRPLTLSFSLAVYGIALFFVPRFMKRANYAELFTRFTVRRRNYQHLRDLLPPASSTCNNTPSSSSSPRAAKLQAFAASHGEPRE